GNLSIGLPDLVIQSGMLPTGSLPGTEYLSGYLEEGMVGTIVNGEQTAVRELRVRNFKIINQGVGVSQPARIQYYLSPDPAVSQPWPFSDPRQVVLLGEMTAPPLLAGDPLSGSLSGDINLPLGDTPAGYYYLIIVVDADNTTRELIEANNRLVLPVELW